MYGTRSNHEEKNGQIQKLGFFPDELKVRKPLIDVDGDSDGETAPLSCSSMEVSSLATGSKKNGDDNKINGSNEAVKPDFIASFSCVESSSSSSKKQSTSKRKGRKSDENVNSSSKLSIKSSPKPSKTRLGSSKEKLQEHSDDKSVSSSRSSKKKKPVPKTPKRTKSIKKSKSLDDVYAEPSSSRRKAKSLRASNKQGGTKLKELDLEATPRKSKKPKRSKSMKKSKSLGDVFADPSSSSKRRAKSLPASKKQDGSLRKSESLENTKEPPKRRNSKMEKPNRNNEGVALDLDAQKEKLRRSKSRQKTKSLQIVSSESSSKRRSKSLRGNKQGDVSMRRRNSIAEVSPSESSSKRRSKSLKVKASKSSKDGSRTKSVDKKWHKSKTNELSNHENEVAKPKVGPNKKFKISVDKFQALMASNHVDIGSFRFESLFQNSGDEFEVLSKDEEYEYEEIIECEDEQVGKGQRLTGQAQVSNVKVDNLLWGQERRGDVDYEYEEIFGEDEEGVEYYEEVVVE